MDENTSGIRRDDEQGDLEGYRRWRRKQIALKNLRSDYRVFLWYSKHNDVITTQVILEAQKAVYGMMTWTKNGLVPKLRIPARFIIGAHFVTVQVANSSDVHIIRREKEEIWPNIARLNAVWVPNLRL